MHEDTRPALLPTTSNRRRRDRAELPVSEKAGSQTAMGAPKQPQMPLGPGPNSGTVIDGVDGVDGLDSVGRSDATHHGLGNQTGEWAYNSSPSQGKEPKRLFVDN